MFIKAITFHHEGKYPIRTSTLGTFRNYTMVIDNYKNKSGKVMEKRFVWWDDFNQWIVNKKRNDKGRFERYW